MKRKEFIKTTAVFKFAKALARFMSCLGEPE